MKNYFEETIMSDSVLFYILIKTEENGNTWRLLLKRALPINMKKLAEGYSYYLLCVLTTWKKELMEYTTTMKLYKVNHIIKEDDNKEDLF